MSNNHKIIILTGEVPGSSAQSADRESGHPVYSLTLEPPLTIYLNEETGALAVDSPGFYIGHEQKAGVFRIQIPLESAKVLSRFFQHYGTLLDSIALPAKKPTVQ